MLFVLLGLAPLGVFTLLMAIPFFLFEVGPDLFTVREYASKDRWASGGWTPAAWRFPVRAPGTPGRRAVGQPRGDRVTEGW